MLPNSEGGIGKVVRGNRWRLVYRPQNLKLERINVYFNKAAGGRYVSRDI